MKRAFLIHGWSGTPEHGFFPWLKAELESRGYVVEAPLMPNPSEPAFETWVPFLESVVGTPDAETIVVGHSMGGLAALRFLERLPEGSTIGKAILVAPVVNTIENMDLMEELVARPWLDRPFDDAKIRRFADKIVGIFSDDDPYILLTSEEIVRNRFGAKTIVEHAKGHYSGDDGTTELPTILQFI